MTNHRNQNEFALTQIAKLVLVVLGHLPALASAEAVPESVAKGSRQDISYVDFNTSFGGLNNSQVDVSRFGRPNPVLPGTYRVDLYVNDARVSREEVVFRDRASENNASACFTRPLLEKMGVNLEKLGSRLDPANSCIDIADILPDAHVQFDPNSLRMDVSIPQVDLKRTARGYVSPELWEQGETAATLAYNLNAYQSSQSYGGSTNGAYLGLNAGLNIGGWRIRNRSALTWASGTSNNWQNINTYVQHDLTRLRSQLTLGDGFTTGELFQSTAFRGANVSSDDRMLPDSLVGYAPTIRGVADSRARVEVRQNNFLVYETEVAPGAFEINDLYATGYGGDLQVSVIEADGRVHTFTVPYAAVPQLLRPGNSRYAATIGQIRNASQPGSLPLFAELTYQRGINNWLTGYTGAQFTDKSLYRSALLGAAVNTSVGAFSVDVTGSQTKLQSQADTWNGYSVRATYSKQIPSTSTDFALAAYRYSSRNYLDLADAVLLNSGQTDASGANALPVSYRARNRLQFSVNQRLGESGGSLYASGSYYSYWNGLPNNTTYQIGYSNRFKNINYSVSVARTHRGNGQSDTQFLLSLSIPLGSERSVQVPMLTSTLASGSDLGTSVRTGVSGVAGEYNQYSYNVSGTKGTRIDDSVDASASWAAPYAVLGGAYSWSNHRQQASVNASGGMVVHAGGVTLAQRMSETIGVVEAKGATGALLGNGSQGKVDGRGYAVVSDLMPYRMNSVMIDPKGTSMDVELLSSRYQVAPRAGAVVPLKFDTVTGRAVLIRARSLSGNVLPFGAQVLDAQSKDIGVVGQGGQIFARTGEDSGALVVRWGDEASQQCKIDYRLPPRDAASETSGFASVEAVCK